MPILEKNLVLGTDIRGSNLDGDKKRRRKKTDWLSARSKVKSMLSLHCFLCLGQVDVKFWRQFRTPFDIYTWNVIHFGANIESHIKFRFSFLIFCFPVLLLIWSLSALYCRDIRDSSSNPISVHSSYVLSLIFTKCMADCDIASFNKDTCRFFFVIDVSSLRRLTDYIVCVTMRNHVCRLYLAQNYRDLSSRTLISSIYSQGVADNPQVWAWTFTRSWVVVTH